MTRTQALINILINNQSKLLASLIRVEQSYLKIKEINWKIEELEDDELEHWESYTSRFSRTIDLFLSKYIRSYLAYKDPGFKGTLRDYLNKMEKLGLINSSESWIELKELRNSQAHEYEEEELDNVFFNFKKNYVILNEIKNAINIIDKEINEIK